jgi:DNA-binding GntR family transcriptional regulator
LRNKFSESDETVISSARSVIKPLFEDAPMCAALVAHAARDPRSHQRGSTLFRNWHGQVGWASAYYQSIVRAPGAEELTLLEHQKIIDAIAKHDVAGAVKAVTDHLTRANELYRTSDL